MKAVKIIMGIIIAISVVFFATGLFVKETKYTTKITISKPLKEVFSTFNNQQKYKEWIPELVSLAPLEEKLGKIGSTYLMIVNSGGQEIKMTQKIVSYVENTKVAYTFDTKEMFKIDEYLFTATNQGTQISKTFSFQSKSYIMGCVFPYFKGKLQEQDQKYLDKFKMMIENDFGL